MYGSSVRSNVVQSRIERYVAIVANLSVGAVIDKP